MSVMDAMTVLKPAGNQPARGEALPKPSLIGLTREEMGAALREKGVPEKQIKMRVAQLWNWIYVRGVSDFDHMANISKDMRETLKTHFTIARPEIVEEQVSNDGTRKWLLRFPARGAGRPVEIEAVYIPEEGRGTLCISSQVGCTLTCSCLPATGWATSPTAKRRRARSCRPRAARSVTS
jgi:23S rRNA (adenine2503-C2)-methyltransferase